jgi:hypothetical protein
MSPDAAPRGPTPTEEPKPEPPPRKRNAAPRKRSKEAPHPWHRSVTRSAKAARKRWGPLDRETAERMARTYRAVIMPRSTPGCKPDQETLRAAKAYQTGMERYFASPDPPRMREYQRTLWQAIYREVIPNYANLDKLERHYRTNKLRCNVRKWLRRRGVKFPLAKRTRSKRTKPNV